VSPFFATAIGEVLLATVGLMKAGSLTQFPPQLVFVPGPYRLWETIIEGESRELAIGYIPSRSVGNVADRRLPDELIERDPGVIDAIATADGSLVLELYAKPIRGPMSCDQGSQTCALLCGRCPFPQKSSLPDRLARKGRIRDL